MKPSKSGPPFHLLTTSSRKSTHGLSQLEAYISADFDVSRIPAEALQETPDNSQKHLLLAHNTLRVPPGWRSYTVVFALQSVVNLLRDDWERRRDWLTCPPRGWIANSKSAAYELRRLGFRDVQWSYRPPLLNCPSLPPELDSNPTVYWYWKEGHPPLEGYRELILETVTKLSNVKFHFFPDSPVDSLPLNSSFSGRLDLTSVQGGAAGLVRVGAPLDFGRSTFSFLAAGRWCLFTGMARDWILEKSSCRRLQRKIVRLLDSDSAKRRTRRLDVARPMIDKVAVRTRLTRILARNYGLD